MPQHWGLTLAAPNRGCGGCQAQQLLPVGSRLLDAPHSRIAALLRAVPATKTALVPQHSRLTAALSEATLRSERCLRADTVQAALVNETLQCGAVLSEAGVTMQSLMLTVTIAEAVWTSKTSHWAVDVLTEPQARLMAWHLLWAAHDVAGAVLQSQCLWWE